MDLTDVYRAEYGRCVATLVRLLGDINLAEEAVQDAFAVALQKWPVPPPNPGAWIVTTARNRAIDRLRRESTREARHAQALQVRQPATGRVARAHRRPARRAACRRRER
jgi:RNA polymerase sigma-70 factor (ECF subfamily)